jgi:hypothetical protein
VQDGKAAARRPLRSLIFIKTLCIIAVEDLTPKSDKTVVFAEFRPPDTDVDGRINALHSNFFSGGEEISVASPVLSVRTPGGDFLNTPQKPGWSTNIVKNSATPQWRGLSSLLFFRLF